MKRKGVWSPWVSSLLKDIDFQTLPRRYVQYLPRKFNGNILFEFQPIVHTSIGSTSLLACMNCKYKSCLDAYQDNEHKEYWSHKFLVCTLCFRCENKYYPHVRNHGCSNETSWDGVCQSIGNWYLRGVANIHCLLELQIETKSVSRLVLPKCCMRCTIG